MNFKKKLLAVAAGICTLVPTIATAQAFPVRPIALVVPFTAGGALDAVARLSAQRAAVLLGQPVVVENIAGAGGTIGAQRVATAQPDGYRLLVGSTATVSLAPAVYKNLGYAPKDLTPIVQISSAPFMLTTSTAFKGNSVADLVQELKAHPGKYNYASTGKGTLVHLAAEQFKAATGTDVQHVPYAGGGAATTSLMSGETLFTITNIPNVLPLVQSGKLKALATSGAKRPATLPQYPTLAESGLSDFEAVVWIGLLGPRGMPVDVVQKLNTVFREVLKDPAIAERLAQQGDEPASGTPAEFAAFLARDAAKWQKVVTSANVTLD